MKSHPKCWKKNKETVAGRGIKKKVESDYYTNTRFYYYYGKQILHFIDKKQQYNRPKRRNKHSLAHILYTLSIKKNCDLNDFKV